MESPLDSEGIDKTNRERFGGNLVYRSDNICNTAPLSSKKYFDVLSRRKHELTIKYCRGGVVLDVCCGTGGRLFALGEKIKVGVGVDFTKDFIREAQERANIQGHSNLSFICGSARELPVSSQSADLAYCFSSLYTIPNVAEVIAEMSRVLKPDGYCILDFGNRFSVNTLVSRAHPELARHRHLSIRAMRKAMAAANLRPVERRCFQLLPLWSDRPRWLYPLLWPGWIQIMEKQICGRMIDEWISNLPGLRNLAFRQIYICGKGEA